MIKKLETHGRKNSNKIHGTIHPEKLYGQEGVDTILAGNGNDTLYGSAGDDLIFGEGNRDLIYGGIGDDTIYGDYETARGTPDHIAATDTIIGGRGNDLLYGFYGNDVYVFNLGDDQDTIVDSFREALHSRPNNGYADEISFGVGINPEDVIISGDDGDLIITIKGTDDKITVRYGVLFYVPGDPRDTKGRIENIRFYDGTVFSITEVLTNLGAEYNDKLNCSKGNDRVYGFAGYDTLLGGEGQDTIYGGDDNDLIDGEHGRDLLYGEVGNDTIYGDKDHYYSSGEDTLIGGKGNDYLDGRKANDLYKFNIGDGHDTIYDSGGSIDTLEFGEGIELEEISIDYTPYDMILKKTNTGETITLLNQFSYPTVNYFKFYNGNIYSHSELLLNMKIEGSPERNDTLKGRVISDHMYDLGGNDILYGNYGNDSQNGGLGEDTLYGEQDHDRLEGGDGNDTILGDYKKFDWTHFKEGNISGEDFLYGGKGNDFLNGGFGNDIYFFNSGDGQDIIYDYDITIDAWFNKFRGYGLNSEGGDVVRFGEGISPDDLIFHKTGNGTLVIDFKSSGDWIKIKHFYEGKTSFGSFQGPVFNTDSGERSDNSHVTVGIKTQSKIITHQQKIEKFEFFDGSVLNYEDIESLLREDLFEEEAHDFITRPAKPKAPDPTYKNWSIGNKIICTGKSSDNISAGKGNDTLDGGDGADNLNGEEDNDYISGGRGDDNLHGGDGNDSLYGGDGNDNIGGGAGSDKLYGEDGNDNIHGHSGNDYIDGGQGNDILSGFEGNDTYVFQKGYGHDIVHDDSGTLVFKGDLSPNDFRYSRITVNLLITLKETNETVNIRDFFRWNSNKQKYSGRLDTFKFKNNETLTADQVIQMLEYHGTNGNDRINGVYGKIYLHGGHDQVNGSSENDTIWCGEGNDIIGHQDGAYLGDDIVWGEEGDDWLGGHDGSDSLYGGNGHDTLGGGNDDDLLVGGKGNDRLEGNQGDDTYTFNLGDGQDTISDANYQPLSSQNDRLVFGSGIKQEDVNFYFDKHGYLYIKVKGTSDSLVIVGQTHFMNRYRIEYFEFNNGDVLYYKDVYKRLELIGTNGQDNLKGWLYDTKLFGYEGNDQLGGGDGSDSLYGDEDNDTLGGGKGDDLLVGGKGNDRLEGNQGDDTYIFNLGDGQDTISDTNYQPLSSQNDRLIFGSGIKQEDLMFTGAGNNLIISLKGTDDKINIVNQLDLNNNYHGFIESIEFKNGDPSLNRAGMLALLETHGTAGNDKLVGTQWGEKMFGYGGNDDIRSGKGDDTIEGGEGNDTLYAYHGNDVLEGGKGNDLLRGEGNNDTYIFNKGDGQDVIDENHQGGGNDTIDFGKFIKPEDVIFTKVGGNLEITFANNSTDKITIINHYSNSSKIENFVYNPFEVVEGSNDNDTLKGTDFDEHLIGKEGKNSLHGKGGNDSLEGGNGNDYLNGGTGADTMNGGAGKDRYIVDNAGDVIIDSEGYDFVTSSINYTLSGGTDVLQLTGNATTGAGNDLDNNIVGNSQVNILDGGEGNDKIFAKAGNDILIGGNGNDYLSGGSGIDTMNGGAGNDRFVVDNINDVIVDSEGYDGVYSYINYTLSSNIEKLCLRDDAVIAEGNDSNNWIEGSSGNNTLMGNKGNDYLAGNKGDDTYIFNAGDGKDRIFDYGISTGDTVQFGVSIEAENIAFFDRDGYYLDIRYGDGDVVSIQQYNASKYSVENIEIKSGLSADINGIINHIATYEATNDLNLNSVNDVYNDSQLMQELQAYWT